jgi:hypothetical protein
MKNILIIIVLSLQILSCNEEQINSANKEVLNNYFPMDIDSQYYFNYKRTLHNSMPPLPIYEICNLYWNVSSKKEENDSVIFFVDEYLDGKRLYPHINADETYYYDTTDVSRQFKFSVIERNDSLIFRQDYMYPTYSFGALKIKYIRNSSEDLITDSYLNEVIVLQKNKGIKHYYNRSVGGNTWEEIELERYYK